MWQVLQVFFSWVSLVSQSLKNPTKVKMFRRSGDKKKDDKKNDSNDPWDRIRKIMGTAGREKTCVVTNLDYMKTSKQAYVFSRNRASREQTHISNRTPDYSHIKDVILCGTAAKNCSKGSKFEIALKSDQSDLLAFLCFVLGKIKDLNSRAPRCLPNIAKFLIMGTFVENFEKSVDVGAKNFCFLELPTVVNLDYSVPQRSGQSHPRLFMMSRATDDYDLSKQIMNSKLSQELNTIGRAFGFIEDMEDALKSGGNGLAKYLAKMYPGRHVALPPISKDSKVLYLRCEWLTPKELLTPGILQMEMCKGRPLKTFHETTEEKATSTASLERLSRVDAETGGWVMQW